MVDIYPLLPESLVTPIETVWSQLKARAAEYASHGEYPQRDHLEATVVQLLNEAHVSPWPPPHIISFYADELFTMIEQQQHHVPAGRNR